MSHQLDSAVGERLKFGEFELAPVARALWRRGELVKLGSRSFEILIALASRPGQILSKDDLTRLVWRGTFVDDTALRVGISALRKALGPGGDRYIATIPGRGYCFVHDVETVAAKPAPKSSQFEPLNTARLPAQARVVGRADSIRTLTGLVVRQRLTTIVGSGGIGKTTVAYPVAEATRGSFPDGARFIDLAAVTDPLHVSSALAAALGVEVRSGGLSPALVAHLRDKRMLLMFDSCEHVVQAAAGLIDGVLRAAPNICVLATSRETLRTTGEQVYRLAPLATPPLSAKLTAAEAMAFPAVELFVERVAAFIGSYQLSDEEAPLAADICRRLDGIALAIELAAGCMEALGIADIVASLDDRFGLLTRGSRTAAPRQQSLRSTLDWSYGLLIDAERTVLQRLAVFVGTITMDAAARVAGPQYAPSELFELLGNLVAKSMVSRDSSSASTRYRLLDTVQAYAAEKLTTSGELESVRRLHAEYYRDRFEKAKVEYEQLGMKEWRALYVPEIGNIRAALEWAFSPAGDVAIGVSLAAAVTPLFLEMSLLSECQLWAETALDRMGMADRHTRQELELRAALGVTFSFTKGNGPDLQAALEAALRIAETLKDATYQFRILTSLYMCHLRSAEFPAAFDVASRAETLSKTTSPQPFPHSADWMLGDVHHFFGNHAEARFHSMAALSHNTVSPHASTVRSGIDPRVHGNLILARTLWLQGFPDQAKVECTKTMQTAEAAEHPVSTCLGLTWMTPLLMYMGDLETAERYLSRLEKDADEHGLVSYQVVAQGFRGELLLRQGDASRAVELLRSTVARFNQFGHRMVVAPLLWALSEALAVSGNFTDSLAAIDEAIARAEASKEFLHFPEFLRIRGEVLKAQSNNSAADLVSAEEYFLRALECARRQSALSWELRAATSLAELRSALGHHADARSVLAPTFGKFVEGFGTGDLRRAKGVLDQLHHDEP